MTRISGRIRGRMKELNLKRWVEDTFVIEGFEVDIKGFS